MAASLSGLANLYHVQKRYEEAERLHQRALDIRIRRLGLEHSTTAEELHDFALLRESQNKEEAKLLYEQALNIRKQALGTPTLKRRQLATSLLPYCIQCNSMKKRLTL